MLGGVVKWTPERVAAQFKLLGLNVTPKAAAVLAAHLVSSPDSYDAIADFLQDEPPKSAVVDESLAATWISKVSSAAQSITESLFTVLTVNDMPKFEFNPAKHGFTTVTKPSSIFGTAQDKLTVFDRRYNVIHQRQLRSPKFATTPLTALESLLGTSSTSVVLGVLSRLRGGQLHLESSSSLVPIDITNAMLVPEQSVFTENSIVLAEGQMKESVFVVNALAQPPPEHRDASLASLGGIDLFGACPNSQIMSQLKQYEEENPEARIFFLSDVWIDNSQVMANLDTLLSGCDDSPPDMIVMLGNFLSRPYGGGSDYSHVLGLFNSLANMLSQHSSICQTTRFVFVPGPNDPCGNLNRTLPYPPLPTCLIEPLTTVLEKVSFPTNPARIRYCTQEIVVFRQDLLSSLFRNNITPYSTSDAVPPSLMLAKTLASQAHLCPLSTLVRPIHWTLEHAFFLFPLPHLTVIGDQCMQYSHQVEESWFANPGSFPMDFSYSVFKPHAPSSITHVTVKKP
ncbi:DNA polymerase epsilon subunit 2 [Pelomyxa schiedti]|nr:DNA polymerase epsilon subunit 2 [Pelomyxa schiedti]KAH3760062.1 DNA polymerase epsilon subunit 2 [Pelomyxa schiedti]